MGSIEYFRTLLDAGADINAPAGPSRGITTLQGAAARGHFGLVLMLLKVEADFNAAPARFECRSALEAAVEHGRLDIVQFLLNASVDSEYINGMRFLRAVALVEEGHYAVSKLLRDYST